MRKYEHTKQAKIIANIRKILIEKHLTQADLAEALEIDGSNVNKLLQNESQLTFNTLATIAERLEISTIDLITYPDKYVIAQSPEAEPVEATLQIKLKKDKKDQVLKLVFGENNLEILNK